MPGSTLRQLGAALVAVALGTAGVLGAVLLPTSATPDSLVSAAPKPGTDESTRVHPVGDGSLPNEAPHLRAPHEPLSSAERGYAYHLACEAMPASARDVLTKPGGELLTADLPPFSARTSARLAAVTVYDYASDEVHQLLVDLTHRDVLRDRAVPGVQLPPTEAETAVALELAISARPAPSFATQYHRLSGVRLLNPGQVSADGGAWRPIGERLADAPATLACGRHRCVQLLVALPSGEYLDTRDVVVDLSTRTVLRTEQEDDARAN